METLIGDPGEWNGAQPMTFKAQWLRCSTAGTSCAPIGGATSPTYRLRVDDVHHTIRLRITATNRDGSASATSRPTGVVKAALPDAPRNVSPPTVSGTTKVGQTLTGNEGRWEGTEPFDFNFQWQRCDKDGNFCASIAGATKKTYTLATADAGNTLRLRIVASNTAGRTTAFSPTTGVIAGTTQPPPPPPPTRCRAHPHRLPSPHRAAAIRIASPDHPRRGVSREPARLPAQKRRDLPPLGTDTPALPSPARDQGRARRLRTAPLR